MEKVQDWSKQSDFNELTCLYKDRNYPKKYMFKGSLSLYRSINGGYITPEEAEEQQKEFKPNINEIIVGSKKLEDQISAIKNIKTL